MPSLSVIILFHQVTPYLVPAVRSVLRQTETDLELLLVDNGTGAGLSALGAEGADARIRLLSFPENRGIARAHNAAVAAARGEFVGLLDSDDIALPDRFARQLAALRRDPALGLVGSAAERIDPAGARLGPQFTLGPTQDHHAFSAYSMPVTTPTLTVRRSLLREFPYREELDCASDYDFFSRAVERMPSCALPQVLGQYRCHPGQATRTRFVAQTLSAGLIRLMTGRRRRGRDDGFAALWEEHRPWFAAPPGLPEIFRHFARRSLLDGQPRLAVYHARKLISVRCRPADLAFALRTALAAGRADPRDAGFLARLFLGGPLRAHRIKPVG